MHWRIASTVLLLSSAACVREISNEERLDRATQGIAPRDAKSAEDLQKINCADVSEGLTKARNENRPENERVAGYSELYDSLATRVTTFEQALARNPDLNYRKANAPVVAARDLCVQQKADVGVEFERYVRELVAVPTVQEIKGGTTVTVARLDYDVLREAIETLNPEDKDTLLSRVTAAEQKVEVKKVTPTTPRRRRGR